MKPKDAGPEGEVPTPASPGDAATAGCSLARPRSGRAADASLQYAHREGLRRLGRRFIIFHGKRHPETIGELEIGVFLSSLAESKVSASTQNQALAALLFMYQEVLGRELQWMGELVHAKRPAHVPVVLTPTEAVTLLAGLTGPTALIGGLLYLQTSLVEIEIATLRRLLPDTRFFTTRLATAQMEFPPVQALVSLRPGAAGRDDIRTSLSPNFESTSRKFLWQFLGITAPTLQARRSRSRG